MVIVESNVKGVNRRSLAPFVARAQRAARLNGRVDVLITSQRRMRALNRQFRGKERATDVLSFPLMTGGGLHSMVTRPRRPGYTKRAPSGDIAICAEIAAENARRLGHSLAAELKVLVLHGLLHLAGYDHETDSGRMARRERILRRRLRLPESLTERAGESYAPPRAKAARGGDPVSPASTRTSRRAGR